MASITRTITYGKDAIAFNVQFRPRKTVAIAVTPDKSVVVTAPEKADLAVVDRRVKDKARWILKQQQFFEQFAPRTPARKYVSGETHLYLGRQYRLKIHSADHSCVKLLGRYIHIHTPTPKDSGIVKKHLDDWYLNHAKVKFQERLDHCFQPFAHLGQSQPNLKLRLLQKRWGSLTPTGNLLLNRELIRAPRQCIDYVVIHELCHLKYPDHSPQFYNFLSLMLPNWEKKKLQLEKILV
ncbi:MAG: SprT family zinc-dependent metalloprotease [Cyanobacteria bacterium J06597_16]